METYKWSKYLIVYQKEELFCYFHKLTADYILTKKNINATPGEYISREEVTLIGNELYKIFRSKKFIVSSELEDQLLYSELIGQLQKKSLEHINMLVTNKCNLNCMYCQIEKNCTNSASVMTISIAKNALDYFFDNCNKEKELTVNITGGEPLTNWSVVKFIIEYCEAQYHGKMRFSLFTNGILLNDNISYFLSDHNVLVIVSLDGPENWHNKYRFGNNQHGSYRESLKGYLIAKNNGCVCAISSVASAEILTNVSDYWNWVYSLKPKSLGLNYPHLLLQNQTQNTAEFDFNGYTNVVLFLHKKAKEEGIYFENFERFNKGIRNHCIRARECQACGRGMTVRSDGYVGTCKSLLVSDIISFSPDQFSYSNNSTFDFWSKRLPAQNKSCMECEAVTICGGGCAYDSYILYHGNIECFDSRLCTHNKRIFKEILSDLCENSVEDSSYCSLVQTIGH